MRDTIADRSHFEKRIATLNELAESKLKAIADGTHKERRPGSARRQIWRNRLVVLESRYSLGDPVVDLRDPFAQIVAELPDIEKFDAHTDNDEVVTLCSWAVLLDDRESAVTLASVLERDEAFHTRAAALLGYFDIHPETDDPRNPMDDYWMGKARLALAEGDAEAASAILYKFVNEEWFQNTYNSGRRVITHTGDKIGHVGYWCYEAAAYAKALKIDDSRLEGHKYYPWDLAHTD